MLIARVVEHEVKDKADAVLVKLFRHKAQVVYRTQSGLYAAVRAYCIAAVIFTGGAVEQRHEVHVIHAELMQVGNLVYEAAELSRKQIHVQHHADGFLTQIPGTR